MLTSSFSCVTTHTNKQVEEKEESGRKEQGGKGETKFFITRGRRGRQSSSAPDLRFFFPCSELKIER